MTVGRALLTAVAVFSLAACGDAPLLGVGERAADWVAADSSDVVEEPTLGEPEPELPQVHSTGEVAWHSALEEPATSEDPLEVLAAVRSRSPQDSFVQADPSEIAAALPLIAFPGLVPTNVTQISSQLVFEPGSGGLSEEWVAAFGFWTVEPYTRSRSVAQRAVLWVARTDLSPEVAAAGCDQFEGRAYSACDATEVGEGPAWLLKTEQGATLVWSDGTYRYELFHRNPIGAEVALDMAGSMVYLNELAPSVG